MKEYHRAVHLLRSKNLEKSYILCNYLTVKCLLEANEFIDALHVSNEIDLDMMMQSTNTIQYPSGVESMLFDDTPKNVSKCFKGLLCSMRAL